MAYPITTRLLCAAQQAYEINVGGPAPASPAEPAPPPSSLVGWLRPPAAQVAGDSDISAVLIGETAAEIIIAYRGTEPPDSLDHQRMVLDWIDNFVDPLVSNSPEVPGSVHYGFSHGVNGLWSWLMGELKGLPQTKPLYVTGHSKGGAMANIAAVKLAAAGHTPFVCTFEAARAGDPTFAAGFDAKVKHATRYEFQDDIVPMLPPTDGFLAFAKKMPFLTQVLSTFISSYVPVGDLRFVNWQGQIVGDSPTLEANRVAHLMNQLAAVNCGGVISEHAIGPGSGAAAAICGPIWKLPVTAAPDLPPGDVPF
jgi:Lipase (class 3)